MNKNSNAALIISQAVCALIEAIGMHAENMQRQALGHSMAYGEEEFMKLIYEHGIGYNDVIQTLSRYEY